MLSRFKALKQLNAYTSSLWIDSCLLVEVVLSFLVKIGPLFKVSLIQPLFSAMALFKRNTQLGFQQQKQNNQPKPAIVASTPTSSLHIRSAYLCPWLIASLFINFTIWVDQINDKTCTQNKINKKRTYDYTNIYGHSLF
jgi:hypothetical protein